MTISKVENSARDSAPAGVKPFILFEVRRRLKLWVVMKNDIYDGSFPDEAGATEAAQRQIRAIVNSGGRAEMITSTDATLG